MSAEAFGWVLVPSDLEDGRIDFDAEKTDCLEEVVDLGDWKTYFGDVWLSLAVVETCFEFVGFD